MNPIESLKKFLGDKPYAYQPNLLVFPQLDAGQLAANFRLLEVGRERGLEDQPAAESLSLDSVESGIISYIETEKLYWHDSFENHLSTFGDRLAALNLQFLFAEVPSAAQQFIGDFKAEILKRQNDLTLERQQVIDSRAHLERFRAENGLLRPARYPVSKVWHLSLVALLCLLEALMNGFFLALGDDFGFLGGASQALLIALLNVGLAFLTGYFLLPQFNHVKLYRKLLGIPGLILYLFLMLLPLNLAVAHYRDALLTGVMGASRVAIDHMKVSPLAILDMQSWVMLGLGLLFAIIGLVDGYRYSDPYPGYEREDLHHRRIYDDYIVKVDDAVDSLRSIRDDAVEVFKSLRIDLARRQRAYEAITLHRTRFINQFNEYLNYLESVGNDLLGIYRTANRRARQGRPVPAHFETRWTLIRPLLSVKEPLSLSTEVFSAAEQETDKALDVSIKELHAAFEGSLDQFKQIDELV